MYIHPLSDVQSKDIGEGTRVWQFSVIFKNAKIGTECNICAHTLVENDVTIGDRVTVKSGVYIWDGITIGNDVFIGPCVAFTNDKMPRSKVYPEKFSRIHLKHNCSIGANATLLPGITVGRYAMVGAGSVVTKDVPDYAVVVGNPAKVIRYIENKK
ncbi:acyltransferase [Aeromonas hydrophila]|uniref:acyltransferase n=1 Tax=Aeromonas hydrophila TaxID=644 RepID=UPI0018616A93|nr:acyltransferase [Aeromonas hydrophila]QNF21264.1 N-acetyltransferase [Aeromonas hydrophila]HDX8597621.1 N-acetyltransferase [Aeromonas dhakensis]HDZ8963312.1 N-acetyltransferase [Aeromonas dhakensis]